jgi:uncharacterized protein
VSAAVVDAPVLLRASNYVIYVDLEDGAGTTLLSHGYTGAYDLVSSSIAAYVRSLDVKPPKPLYGSWSDDAPGEATLPSGETLRRLTERGYLTQMSRAEEREFFDAFVRMKHKHELATMPSYIVMPTYDCNLRCGYCFQDHMRTNPAYHHLLRTMTPALIDRMMAALPGIEARHGISPETTATRPFTFFGGEPLLAQSRPVVEYIMKRALELGPASFSAVTNATELGAYADLLGPGGISVLQITIDGPRDRHDARRISADGSGSFDRIATSVDLALDRGVNVDIRMNVDRTNADTLAEVAEFFAARGWPARENFSVYAAPVHATNEATDRKTCFNNHELNEALAALRLRFPALGAITTADDGLRTRLRRVLRDGGDPMPIMKATFCGAHTGMYVLDPFGDIYACWERTGDKNLRVGWIDEQGTAQFIADRFEGWRSRTVTSNETCAQCRYAMYCGGGCAVLAEEVHGTMFGNYCDAFGRRFRLGVRSAYATRHERPVADERVLELRAL